jgi:hypothetical protein
MQSGAAHVIEDGAGGLLFSKKGGSPMRRIAKIVVAAVLLIGLSLEMATEAQAQQPSTAARRAYRRYSIRGGVPFSYKGRAAAGTRDATSKARGDYAPYHGGNYIP